MPTDLQIAAIKELDKRRRKKTTLGPSSSGDALLRKVAFNELERRKNKGAGQPESIEIDTQTGLQDFFLRMKMGFAETPKGRENLLKKKYPDTHRLPDGRLVFKNPETDKLTTVDEQGLSLGDLADLVSVGPEIIGGTVGALLAGPTPPLGQRLALVGAGTGVGRAAKQGIGKLLGIEEERTTKERLTDIGISAGAGAVGEGIGAGIIKAAAPFAKQIIPEIKEGMKAFSKYKGGRLTPAQATETRVLDILENISEGSLFGGGRITRFKQTQEQALEKWAEDIVTEIGTRASPEEVGILVQSAISKKRDAFNAAAKGLYSKVDNLAKDEIISTTSLKSTARRMLDKMIMTSKETVTKEVPSKILTAAGKPVMKTEIEIIKKQIAPTMRSRTAVKILRDFSKLPDEIPFNFAQTLRSDLLEVSRQGTDLLPGKIIGVAKNLSKELNRSIDDAGRGLNPEALEAFKNANRFWASGKNTFNNKMIKALSNKNPDIIVKTILRPGRVSDIKRVRSIVDKETWQELQRHFVKDIFENATDIDGIILGKNILGSLKRYTQPTLNEILPSQQIKDIRTFATIAKHMQIKQGEGMGRMLVQLTQGGAAVALFTGSGFKKEVAAILLGPLMLGRAFTSPTIGKWLTTGLKLKAGTKQAITLGTRIMTALGREKYLEGNKDTTQPSKQFENLSLGAL